MSVKIHIPEVFREYTGKKEIVEVNGNTIGKCFDDLVIKFPALKSAIYVNEKLASFIPVYKETEPKRKLTLGSRVKDGDDLIIVFLQGP